MVALKLLLLNEDNRHWCLFSKCIIIITIYSLIDSFDGCIKALINKCIDLFSSADVSKLMMTFNNIIRETQV